MRNEEDKAYIVDTMRNNAVRNNIMGKVAVKYNITKNNAMRNNTVKNNNMRNHINQGGHALGHIASTNMRNNSGHTLGYNTSTTMIEPYLGGFTAITLGAGVWHWAFDEAIFFGKGIPLDGAYSNWGPQESQGQSGKESSLTCMRMKENGDWFADSCSRGDYVLCETRIVKGTLYA